MPACCRLAAYIAMSARRSTDDDSRSSSVTAATPTLTVITTSRSSNFNGAYRRREDLVGDLADVGERGAADEDGELVATEAGEQVAVDEHGVHTVSEAHQHLVADVVTERVVDVLEVVEVEHQDRRAVESVREGQRGIDRFVEGDAVEVTGQIVVRRCVPHRAVQPGPAQCRREVAHQRGATVDASSSKRSLPA